MFVFEFFLYCNVFDVAHEKKNYWLVRKSWSNYMCYESSRFPRMRETLISNRIFFLFSIRVHRSTTRSKRRIDTSIVCYRLVVAVNTTQTEVLKSKLYLLYVLINKACMCALLQCTRASLSLFHTRSLSPFALVVCIFRIFVRYHTRICIQFVGSHRSYGMRFLSVCMWMFVICFLFALSLFVSACVFVFVFVLCVPLVCLFVYAAPTVHTPLVSCFVYST